MTVKEIQSQLEYLKFSRDEVHGCSKAIGKLFDLTASYVHDAEQAYKNGKNAVWAMGGWEVGARNFPSQLVTEISCHAMGAHFLNSKVKSIVDIGGQDSKAIKVDPNSGKVVDFVMNDKCAAGTGRFLEKVALLLDLTLEQLGDEALKATTPSDISSQCVVFAESEVISLKAKGEKRADIAAGIHIATARRVRNLLNRIGLEPDLVFTGGVSNNVDMKKALEDVLGHPISEVKLDPTYAGALGAAVFAQKYHSAGSTSEKQVLAERDQLGKQTAK
ncbi:MAG TPA: acyl-CoA dehydratase activase [Desulfosporosinus sp.]|nr:acyl-CoA dehydratase activase [Desulfosporosinus sp.]